MLKREIKYEDFDGVEQVDTVYFNLTKSELIEMEVSYENGLEAAIKRITETQDRAGLIAEFKKIILAAYGVKSEDGKRFIKTPELREEFTQSLAYDSLFMELATNDDAAADFIKGIMPREVAAQISTLENETPTPPKKNTLPENSALPTPPVGVEPGPGPTENQIKE